MDPIYWTISILGSVALISITVAGFLWKSRSQTLPAEVRLKLELHDKDIELAAEERKQMGERIVKLETNQENTSKGIERIEKKLEMLNNNIITFLQQEITELKSSKIKK